MDCRESWKALAAGKVGAQDPKGAAEGQHVHLQFCNMIINDSTYLLGEALEKLPQVRVVCRNHVRAEGCMQKSSRVEPNLPSKIAKPVRVCDAFH